MKKSFLIIILIGGILYFFLNTTLGLKTLVALAPYDLTVQKCSGTLLGPIYLQKLSYNSVFKAENIYIDWNLKALFNKKLHIKKLSAENFEFTPGKSSTGKWQLHLQLDDIQLVNSATHSLITIKDSFYNGKAWQLNARYQTPEALILTSGGLLKTWNFRWQAKITNLAYVNPQLKGTATSSGVITGSLKTPMVTGTLTANALKLKDTMIAKLSSNFVIKLGKYPAAKILCQIKNLQQNEIALDTLNLNGVLNANKLTLTTYPCNLYFATKKYLKLDTSQIQAILTKKQLVLKANLHLPKNPLYLELNLPHWQITNPMRATQKLQGKLAWHTSLDFLPKITGNLKLNYILTGTLTQPKILGTWVITDGNFTIPAYHLKVQGKVAAQQNNAQLAYQAQLHSGAGALQLEGKTALTKDIPTTIKIQGSNFLAINTPEYKIVVSPKLQLQNYHNQPVLTGSIYIPYATINPTSYSDFTLPNEVIFVDSKVPDTPNLDSHIELSLGDQVTVKNVMGFSGQVIGKLQIHDSPNRPTTATGLINLTQGFYNIYGQKLAITAGKFQFAGNTLTNPNLDIKAIRKFTNNNLVVGLHIQGTADNPKANLFAIPSGLSKTDILTYLVIGQPTEQVQDNKLQLLMQAANALNLGGSGELNIINKLQQHLGLSDFGLTAEVQNHTPLKPQQPTTTKTTTAFMLGKYLTPKIYISYSMSLLDAVNIFRLRYILGKYWSLQSENSSLGNGADLLFSIEH